MFMLLLPTVVALVPALKADTLEYKISSSFGDLSVTFDLSSFENPANDITTFLSGTLDGHPLIAFGISGDANSNCDDGHGGIGSGHTCWVARNNTSSFPYLDYQSPVFGGVGTYTYTEPTTSGFTTVEITDLSTVPEPSAIILLTSALVAVGLVKRRRQVSGRCAGGSL
jgi:hypothetical protein